MKPVCNEVKTLTRGQIRRNERARLHQQRKSNGWYGDRKMCDLCGGWASWCGSCNTYTSTCCVEYGTCMCS